MNLQSSMLALAVPLSLLFAAPLTSSDMTHVDPFPSDRSTVPVEAAVDEPSSANDGFLEQTLVLDYERCLFLSSPDDRGLVARGGGVTPQPNNCCQGAAEFCARRGCGVACRQNVGTNECTFDCQCPID